MEEEVDSWKVINEKRLPFDKEQRLITPKRNIPDFLSKIHAYLGHPGISKMKKSLKAFFTL